MTTPYDIPLARDLCAEKYKREHQYLLQISKELRRKGVDAQAVLSKGNPADIICEKASELDADLLILGSHGQSMLHKVLLGSVSESVIRHAPCSVVLVPAHPQK